MTKAICLIIPPSGFLLDERVFMSLGILYVAASLKQAGYLVEVLDLSGVPNYLEVTANYARRTRARVFGLTATSPQLPPAVAIARTLRAEISDARVILGGPHGTLVNAARKKGRQRAEQDFQKLLEAFDVVVAGDGERAIFKALQPEAPRLVDADDKSSDLWLQEEELNLVPARDLVEANSYHYHIGGEKALSLIAQRGCPFACGFCGGRSSASLRIARMRDPESVVEEMAHIYSTYGVKGFMFYDDELNVSKKKVVPLMRLIARKQKELGVEWKLRGFIKAELFEDEQAEAMREAGFEEILVGFESGSPQILEVINKKATREDNDLCVEIARRHQLKVKALMSIGHPGESLETIIETEEWLLKARPANFDLSLITTYPGTPYYDEAVDQGGGVWLYTSRGLSLFQQSLDYTEDEAYYKGRFGDYRSFVWTPELTSEALVAERDRVERSVRATLGIPYPQDLAATLYDHSMGQGSSSLPSSTMNVT